MRVIFSETFYFENIYLLPLSLSNKLTDMAFLGHLPFLPRLADGYMVSETGVAMRSVRPG